jgi:hypothetical protein
MRQRVVKVLAALIVTVGGVVATAIAAGASGDDSNLVPVFTSDNPVLVSTDSNGWL